MKFLLRTAVFVLLCAGSASALALDARTASSYDLLTASADALKAGHVEDSVFYFYAGQLRRRLEMGLYPPDDESGGSEAVYALQHELGAAINLVAFDQPGNAQKALNRYDVWTPAISPGFQPLWKSSHPVPLSQVAPVITASKADFSRHMHGMFTLLQDPEYYRLFHVQRDCNMQPEGKRPAQSACAASEQGMLRIEKKRGIEGAATMQARD